MQLLSVGLPAHRLPPAHGAASTQPSRLSPCLIQPSGTDTCSSELVTLPRTSISDQRFTLPLMTIVLVLDSSLSASSAIYEGANSSILFAWFSLCSSPLSCGGGGGYFSWGSRPRGRCSASLFLASCDGGVSRLILS